MKIIEKYHISVFIFVLFCGIYLVLSWSLASFSTSAHYSKMSTSKTNSSTPVTARRPFSYPVKSRSPIYYNLSKHNTPVNVSNQSNLTIATAFFNIGQFGKGSPYDTRSQNTYLTWAKTFRFLVNPLVVYTDSEEFFKHMDDLRENFTSRTKIFLFDRKSSWAFQRRDKIKEIFNMKGYPRHYPNTVVPEYACAMHAKYDVISRAASENYFQTEFFAWLDIGLFRAEVDRKEYFLLELPPDFNYSKIAVTQVYADTKMDETISNIVRDKLDWICGCIFVGKRDVILKYAEQYKRAVDYLLSKNLMNSDQQVLYALYSVPGRKEMTPNIDLQIYMCHEWGYDKWFYLGYIIRKLLKNNLT